MARNLSRWVQGIVARVYEQRELEHLAQYANIPVINALSDRYHPCQAYADFFTLQERFGNLRGLKIGLCRRRQQRLPFADGRRRARGRGDSRGHAGGLRAHAAIVAEARRRGARNRRQDRTVSFAPKKRSPGAQAVYTDVWASMGQEEETAARAKIFAPYQVNARLMQQAAPDAVFLHCLPAHRGAEVTDEVMDSPRSIVFDQAENRLHVQKAILLMLLS